MRTMKNNYSTKNVDILYLGSIPCVGFSLIDIAFPILNGLLLTLQLLGIIAFFTLFERKLMSSVQRRRGPDVVGFWGLLQPIADGLKLVIKEFIVPSNIRSIIFNFAPLALLTISLTCWAFIPFSIENYIIDLDLSLLFVLGFSSLGVYGLVAAGWSSYSKYALLGSMRAIAQLVSYEISLSLLILPVIGLSGSLNIIEIVEAQKPIWFLFTCFPCAIMFSIVMLAETNRTPFDLPEAEAELVAGFNVEYSSTAFAMFFLAEYGSMFLMSALFVILFCGGWLGGLILFIFKILFVVFFFVLVRAKLPRYRYDQLMNIGWKQLLVLGFGYFVFIYGALITFDASLFPPDLLWNEYVRVLQASRIPLIGIKNDILNV